MYVRRLGKRQLGLNPRHLIQDPLHEGLVTGSIFLRVPIVIRPVNEINQLFVLFPQGVARGLRHLQLILSCFYFLVAMWVELS